MKTKILRQGDVLLIPIETTARGKDVRENNKVILAHGEATGHAHEIIGDEITLEEITDETDALRGARILRVLGKATVTHQEHAPIVIPPGTYRVVRQREYSPVAIRNVAD